MAVCSATIGRHGFIGAGAVVTNDDSGCGLMTSVPVRCSGRMCVWRVKLRDETMQVMGPECGWQYTRRGEKVALMEAD